LRNLLRSKQAGWTSSYNEDSFQFSSHGDGAEHPLNSWFFRLAEATCRFLYEF
jgi:hypothetical protein